MMQSSEEVDKEFFELYLKTERRVSQLTKQSRHVFNVVSIQLLKYLGWPEYFSYAFTESFN